MNKYHLHSFLLLFSLILISFRVSAEDESWTPKNLKDPFTIDSTRYVADPSDFISPEYEAKINKVAALIKWQGYLEYAVVVLPSIDEDYDIFSFSHELYENWGLGKDSRGLLLVVQMDAHEWQFITGYGAEGVLPDAFLKRVGEEKMVPDFKEDEYGKGILAATEEILHIVTDDVYYQDEVARMEEEDAADGMTILWISVIIYVCIAMILTMEGWKRKNEYKVPYIVEGGKANAKKNADDSPVEVKIPGSRSMGGIRPGMPIFRFVVYYLPVILAPLLSGGDPWTCFLYLLLYNTYLCVISMCVTGIFLRHRSRDRFEKMLNLRRLNRSYTLIVFLFICPWCWIFFKLLFAALIAAAKRNLDITCPACGGLAPEVTGPASDEYISENQRFEMKIGSARYRIFKCPDGHIIRVTTPGPKESKYSKCPQCGTLAMKVVSKKVVKNPTTTSKGKQENTSKCLFCDNVVVTSIDIARISSSSSSSGGGFSGGGRSGGSFGGSRGGGFSGGGGARGGW